MLTVCLLVGKAPSALLFLLSSSHVLTWLVPTNWSWSRTYLLGEKSWGSAEKARTAATIHSHSLALEASPVMCCHSHTALPRELSGKTISLGQSLPFAEFEVIILQPNLWKEIWKLHYLCRMFCPIKTLFITFNIKFCQWENIPWWNCAMNLHALPV